MIGEVDNAPDALQEVYFFVQSNHRIIFFYLISVDNSN